MAQVQSVETFVNGQQVTAARLNNHVNGLLALPGLVTDQTAMTANTIENIDQFIVYDSSVQALRKVNFSDVLNSNRQITTPSIYGPSSADLTLNPQGAYKVNCLGPLTTATLTVNQTSTFSGKVTASGTGTIRIPAGTTAERPTTGNLPGDIRYNTTSGRIESNAGGTNWREYVVREATNSYALYEISEESIPRYVYPVASAPNVAPAWTSASYTKPASEIWVVEIDLHWRYYAMGSSSVYWCRITDSAGSTSLINLKAMDAANSNYNDYQQDTGRYVIGNGTTWSGTFKLNINGPNEMIITPSAADYTASGSSGYTVPSYFRIYKYRIL